MKKMSIAVALLLLVSAQAFAAYTVVLKDGTRYQAKAKWTIVNGKAIVSLKNGQTIQLDPALIDVAKSEQATKDNLGDARVLGVEQQSTAATQQQKTSLGSAVRTRPRAGFETPVPPAAASSGTAPVTGTAPVAPVANQLDRRVSDNFERAYENVGIYEHVMSGTNNVVRAEITADTEDRVFQALTATAFLVVRNAGVDGITIEMVELFMKTTTGGAAGRFRMSRADAEALNTRRIPPSEYFVRNVIY